MDIVMFYMGGVAMGILFSLFLWVMVHDTKVVGNFIQKTGVSEDQIITTMTLLWPITITTAFVLVTGYSLHSLYVVIKALIGIVRGRQ